MSNKITLSDQLNSLKSTINILNKYKVALYILFILCLYIFLIVRISGLENVTSLSNNNSVSIVPAQHLNQTVVNQLEQLQNNNVNVQSLFQQARNNPF